MSEVLAIPVMLGRFDAATGTALHQFGLRLLAGRLFPDQDNVVSVWQGGVEVACAVRIAEGRHLDGSVAVVGIQLVATIGTSHNGAEIEVHLGVPAAVPRVAWSNEPYYYDRPGTIGLVDALP